MKNKDIKIENIEKREVTPIEITWDNIEDLVELSDNDEFRPFILKESFKAITHALDSNLDKAELFNIFNMSVIIEIKSPQFRSVLNKINILFLENEDYEGCDELKLLIKKYKL